jgi:hypothetical protein
MYEAYQLRGLSVAFEPDQLDMFCNWSCKHRPTKDECLRNVLVSRVQGNLNHITTRMCDSPPSKTGTVCEKTCEKSWRGVDSGGEPDTCAVGGASALCDAHLCSLHSAHAHLAINMQLYTHNNNNNLTINMQFCTPQKDGVDEDDVHACPVGTSLVANAADFECQGMRCRDHECCVKQETLYCPSHECVVSRAAND